MEFNDRFQVDHHQSPAYAHYVQGIVERRQEVIQSTLNMLTQESGGSWDDHVSTTMYTLNASLHAPYKTSPLEALCGHIHSHWLPDFHEVDDTHPAIERHVTRLLRAQDHIRDMRADIDKNTYGKLNATRKAHTFQVGDKVYIKLHSRASTKKGYVAQSAKQQMRYFGPVTVAAINTRRVQVLIPQDSTRSHGNSTKSQWIAVEHLKRCTYDDKFGPNQIIPYTKGTARQYDWAKFLNEELSSELHQFDQIIKIRYYRHIPTNVREAQFCVQWSNPDDSDPKATVQKTWEPMSVFFDNPQFLVEYLRDNKLHRIHRQFADAYKQIVGVSLPTDLLPVAARTNQRST